MKSFRLSHRKNDHCSGELGCSEVCVYVCLCLNERLRKKENPWVKNVKTFYLENHQTLPRWNTDTLGSFCQCSLDWRCISEMSTRGIKQHLPFGEQSLVIYPPVSTCSEMSPVLMHKEKKTRINSNFNLLSPQSPITNKSTRSRT